MQAPQSGSSTPIRRMPTAFFPSISPRQGPDGLPFARGKAGAQRRTVLSFVARSESAALRPLLPERVELLGDPRVHISVTWLEGLGWLAGRGYTVLQVQIPARVLGARDPVEGEFVPVLWENLADPIITGREELGMPKVFADISALSRTGDRATCQASWDGFVFFEGEVTGLTANPDGIGEHPGAVTINHKYMPRTGAWGEADADYLTCSAGDEPDLVTAQDRGHGRARFISGTWEQLPTLRHIVKPLAALPLIVTGATLTTLKGSVDLRSQRIIE